LGGQRDQHADVRILAATNKKLKEEVDGGRFRHDLLYRIDRIQLHVPPLRERREDIPLLVKYYLEYFNVKLHRPLPEIPDELMEIWCRYDWPGNVRELSSEIENLVLFSVDGKIDRSRLRIPPTNHAKPEEFFKPFFDLPYEQAKEKVVAQFQQAYFPAILARCDGSASRAAKVAGVNRSTMYRILEGLQENQKPK
jgi:transcriptional regulator with PAS, ATPase and Fis domain